MTKLLICTVGLPRCGKSTWAKTTNWPMVNPDSIRLGLHNHSFIGEAEDFVWAIAKVMVRSLFITGHDIVVLDATNTLIERRNNWRSVKWETKFKLFDPFLQKYSRDTCLSRTEDVGLIKAINKMADNWQSLCPEELQF